MCGEGVRLGLVGLKPFNWLKVEFRVYGGGGVVLLDG